MPDILISYNRYIKGASCPTVHCACALGTNHVGPHSMCAGILCKPTLRIAHKYGVWGGKSELELKMLIGRSSIWISYQETPIIGTTSLLNYSIPSSEHLVMKLWLQKRFSLQSDVKVLLLSIQLKWLTN